MTTTNQLFCYGVDRLLAQYLHRIAHRRSVSPSATYSAANRHVQQFSDISMVNVSERIYRPMHQVTNLPTRQRAHTFNHRPPKLNVSNRPTRGPTIGNEQRYRPKNVIFHQ